MALGQMDNLLLCSWVKALEALLLHVSKRKLAPKRIAFDSGMHLPAPLLAQSQLKTVVIRQFNRPGVG
jgi:hypothetical protein